MTLINNRKTQLAGCRSNNYLHSAAEEFSSERPRGVEESNHAPPEYKSSTQTTRPRRLPCHHWLYDPSRVA